MGNRYISQKTHKKGILPLIETTASLDKALRFETKEGLNILYLENIGLTYFSPLEIAHPGKSTVLLEEDLKGRVYFNENFFQRFDPPRPKKRRSDMRNLAKAFFRLNWKNHVALVQYLFDGGKSNEHYHTLPELICQLAGRSLIETRPIENDTDIKRTELCPGEICRILPNTLHTVNAISGGSITAPIKQTKPHRKDHLYIEKSNNRINQELKDLLKLPHYNSGNEIIGALDNYFSDLRSENEKARLTQILNESEKREKNPNLKQILKEFLRRIS